MDGWRFLEELQVDIQDTSTDLKHKWCDDTTVIFNLVLNWYNWFTKISLETYQQLCLRCV